LAGGGVQVYIKVTMASMKPLTNAVICKARLYLWHRKAKTDLDSYVLSLLTLRADASRAGEALRLPRHFNLHGF